MHLSQKTLAIIVIVIAIVSLVFSSRVIYNYYITLRSYETELRDLVKKGEMPSDTAEEFYKIRKDQYQVLIGPAFGWSTSFFFFFANQKEGSRLHWNEGEMTLNNVLPQEGETFLYNFSEPDNLEEEIDDSCINHLNFTWELDNAEKDAIKKVIINNLSIHLIPNQITEDKNKPNDDDNPKEKKCSNEQNSNQKTDSQNEFRPIEVTCKDGKIIPVQKKRNGFTKTVSKSGEVQNVLELKWLINPKNIDQIFGHFEKHIDEESISLKFNAVVIFKRRVTQVYWHEECQFQLDKSKPQNNNTDNKSA